MILKPKQKYTLIRSSGIDISLGCMIARVSRSGYHKWFLSADKPGRDHADYLAIKEIFDTGKKKYGFRTIHMKLLAQGILMNHKKISRIMQKYGLMVAIRRKNPYKTLNKCPIKYIWRYSMFL